MVYLLTRQDFQIRWRIANRGVDYAALLDEMSRRASESPHRLFRLVTQRQLDVMQVCD